MTRRLHNRSLTRAAQIPVLLLVAPLCGWGQLAYSPKFQSPGTPPSGWTGVNNPVFSNNALVDNGRQDGASLLATVASGAEQEVKTTIHLVNQPGAAGAFVMYHRASSNALSSGTGPQGTFYAVEVQLSFSNGQCSAGMYV
jgi:hypothetical protein